MVVSSGAAAMFAPVCKAEASSIGILGGSSLGASSIESKNQNYFYFNYNSIYILPDAAGIGPTPALVTSKEGSNDDGGALLSRTICMF